MNNIRKTISDWFARINNALRTYSLLDLIIGEEEENEEVTLDEMLEQLNDDLAKLKRRSNLLLIGAIICLIVAVILGLLIII